MNKRFSCYLHKCNSYVNGYILKNVTPKCLLPILTIFFLSSFFEKPLAQDCINTGPYCIGLAADQSDIVLNCTKTELQFEVFNLDENTPLPITIDLFLIEGASGGPAFNLVDNPGFVNVGVVTFGTRDYINWRLAITLPAQLEPISIPFSIVFVEAYAGAASGILFSATDGGTGTTGVVSGPFLNQNVTFVTVGTLPTDATQLSTVANGGLGELELPPGNTQQDVVVNGTLVIDTDYSFIGQSRLYMGPNATIRVADNLTGNTFTLIDMTSVRGCQSLWNGIEVENNATLEIDGSTDQSTPGRVEIRDATNAVVAKDGSTVMVNNARFQDNVIGITSPASAGSPADVNFTVTDNIFEGSGFGAMPLAGVVPNDLENVLVLQDNVYQNMSFGILSTNSSIFSDQESFLNLASNGINTVSDSDHFLFQLGLGESSQTPTFDQVPYGIVSRNVSVGSENNFMKDVFTGYSFRHGTFKNIQLLNNTIDAESNGMTFTDWRPIEMVVDDNTINVNGSSVYESGILNNLLVGQLFGEAAVFSNNEINLQGAVNGVHSTSSGVVIYQGNTINLLNAQPYDGFNMDASFINLMDCNTVVGTDANNLQAGFNFALSALNFVNCNATDNMRQGIFINGDNNPTIMQGNSFGDHFHGLQIGDPQINDPNFPGANLGGITGVQSHHGNTWDGTYSNGTEGAGHYGSQQQILESQHKVDDTDGPNLVTDEPTGQPVSLFFIEEGNTFSCPGSCPPPINDFNDDDISETDKRIADGTLVPNAFADGQGWTAKRKLYRRLLNDPSLISAAPEITTFYNTEANTTVGKFESLHRSIEALFELDDFTVGQKKTDLQNIRSKAGQLLAVEQQLANDPDPQQEAALLSQQTTLQQDISTLIDAQTLENGTLKSNRISTAAQLLATNNAIFTANSYELNQKEYNKVFLEMIVNDQSEPDQNQRVTLLGIASLCPYAEGEAVYQSRALLGDVTTTYDDVAICNAVPRPRIEMPENTQVDFMVYPNPSNGYVFVELDKEAHAEGTAKVTNSLGQLLMTQDFAEGTKIVLVLLEDLPSGNYFLNVKTGSKTSTKMFSILK